MAYSNRRTQIVSRDAWRRGLHYGWELIGDTDDPDYIEVVERQYDTTGCRY